jgi:hypothetical protein
MMRAVHLSAIRSSTSREGHCASITDGGEEGFGMPLSNLRLSHVQAESNIRKDVYRQEPHVVDCRFSCSKFNS